MHTSHACCSRAGQEHCIPAYQNLATVYFITLMKRLCCTMCVFVIYVVGVYIQSTTPCGFEDTKVMPKGPFVNTESNLSNKEPVEKIHSSVRFPKLNKYHIHQQKNG